MKTARLIWKRDTDPERAATRCLWQVDADTYLVTSSVKVLGISETMTFPSDALGEVTDWFELGVAGYGDHEGALLVAGYEVG